MKASGFLLVPLLLLSALPAHALELGLPIDCQLGQTCFIQNYFDHGAKGHPKDYRCGSETYGGHDGTDFRILALPPAGKLTAVIAPASGVVQYERDGIPDHIVRSDIDIRTVAPYGCGNGAVIDVGDGYQVELCHMLNGTVKVKPGDVVSRGDVIGTVGASGSAGFAHVHLGVLKNGKPVDPFVPALPAGSCLSTGDQLATSLFDPVLRPALSYQGVTILDAMFVAAPIATDFLEDHSSEQIAPTRDGSDFILYVRLMHLEVGDKVQLRAVGPGGYQFAVDTPPASKPQALSNPYLGPQRPAGGWAPGLYQGLVRVIDHLGRITQAQVQYELK